MRHNPDYLLTDLGAIRGLIDEHPFVTLVSATTRGPVASHYPVLVEQGGDDTLVLLGHVGRPDEELHELGRHEVLVIVQGTHGYVSSSWYPDRSVPAVPTWNFQAAHLYGRPEILTPEENYRILGLLVDRFESRVAHPRPMEGSPVDAAYARRIQHGTVGFRIPVTRIQGKAKLSQDKPESTVRGVLAALESDGAYRSPDLAAAMRAALAERQPRHD